MPVEPSSGRRIAVGAPLAGSLTVVLFLATVGSFGIAFGVMTACTDDYSCTSAACPPCGAAATWLNAGWVGQGILLLAGLVLAVLARRRIRPRVVRTAAMVLAGLSIGLVAVTTALAVGSY